MFDDAIQRLPLAFERGKADPRIGSSMGKIFKEIGFTPSMMGGTVQEQGGQGYAPKYVASTTQSLLPLIVQSGLATEAEVDMDTLEQHTATALTSPTF